MMMKSTRLLVLVLLVLQTAAMALALTTEERTERYQACFDFAALVPGGIVTPQWLPESSFWWVDGGDTLAVTKDGLSIPVPMVKPEVEPAAAETGPARPHPVSEKLPGPGGNLALIMDNNLWFENSGGELTQITDDGTDKRMWTLWGALWSPDGETLALSHFDVSEAPTIPIVDWLDPAAPVLREPSSQACEKRGQQQLHLFRVKDGLHLQSPKNENDSEPWWQALHWTPDGQELLAFRFNRVMNRQDLFALNPVKGTVRAVLSETSDTFIDGLTGTMMTDWYLTPLADGEHFIWLSSRDGFHHLYLYRYDGSLVRRLTHGDFPVLKIQGVDPDAGWVYFMAKPDGDDPTSQHLCRVNLNGEEFRQLTTSAGRRTVHLSPDYRIFVENHSDLDRAPISVLRHSDGTFIRELARADETLLKAMDWVPPQHIMTKAADGKSDCYCALYLPPEFDPEKKYPVIEMIYAGPQWMIVPRRMPAGEYGDTATALSQLGYVVVIVDSPGTAGVGRSYQDAVFGKLGTIEIPDHVAAIRNLGATRPWMDLSKVGVHGKSWGGYFALRAILMAPDFYRVGVASSAVADLRTTGESPVVPYLGLPADDPEAYEAANCLTMADRLQGDLLITIGTADRNTPFGQTMRMIEAFHEAGKDVDLLILPGQHHWLQGASFERWQRALRDHFLMYLPPVR